MIVTTGDNQSLYQINAPVTIGQYSFYGNPINSANDGGGSQTFNQKKQQGADFSPYGDKDTKGIHVS